ncbi:hypothetical protein V1264_021097 [Littorina saxatilis]|uniref:Uncharacterized protein n=1 Tax=Littorina saxatilis TaxID=31220 RepID=A0AAN9GCA3_9CAEN
MQGEGRLLQDGSLRSRKPEGTHGLSLCVRIFSGLRSKQTPTNLKEFTGKERSHTETLATLVSSVLAMVVEPSWCFRI